VPLTFRNVSFMPANEAASVSSAVAEERTATGAFFTPERSCSYAAATCSAIQSGIGVARISSRSSAVTSASAFESSTSRSASRSPRRPRRPVSSMNAA
jgi:hypothetical protein